MSVTSYAPYVRKLIADKAHTQESAAAAIGISARSMRRYVSNGPAYLEPPMVVLVALRGLPKKRPKVRKAR